MNSEIMVRKKLRGHYWEPLNEIFNRIGSVYRYYINIVYVLCKEFFSLKS